MKIVKKFFTPVISIAGPANSSALCRKNKSFLPGEMNSVLR